MWQCFTVFRKKSCVFLVLLRFFDLSVSPAEREKLSPSKLALVKPVKVQPCRTPNTSASFLETHKFAKNNIQLNHCEHLGIRGNRSCIVILNISKVMDKVYVLHENLYVQSPEKFWNKNEKLGFWSVCFAWKPISPVTREVAETSLLAGGHVQLPAPRAVGADLD